MVHSLRALGPASVALPTLLFLYHRGRGSRGTIEVPTNRFKGLMKLQLQWVPEIEMHGSDAGLSLGWLPG